MARDSGGPLLECPDDPEDADSDDVDDTLDHSLDAEEGDQRRAAPTSVARTPLVRIIHPGR